MGAHGDQRVSLAAVFYVIGVFALDRDKDNKCRVSREKGVTGAMSVPRGRSALPREKRHTVAAGTDTSLG